jgi:molybdopterin/thiamine biosynthesis adenylyltransferase
MSDLARIQILHLDGSDEEESILNLLKNGVVIFDLSEVQIKEWERNIISLGERTFGFEKIQLDERFTFYKDCVFIYYPWKNSILVTFKIEVFRSLRYLRNKYKITSQEQELLLGKEVVIVGMSVGLSVFKAMVLEGLAGKYRISDFDTIDITNLNRIDTGIFSVGRQKVLEAYQFAMEQDPFLEVQVWDCPIEKENISFFLDESVDLIVDECDSIVTKVMLRRKARELSAPLIMHTSDRGMLDIELYNDLNFDASWTLEKYGSYSEDDIKLNAISIIADFCDLKGADQRAQFSFSEIGKSITSWPQLGGDVLAGGGNVASAARSILLGHKVKAGRYLLDPVLQFKAD